MGIFRLERTEIEDRGVYMSVHEGHLEGRTEPGFVNFLSTGDAGRGDFRCAECGYGVCVSRVLPTCPMCGSEAWERGWMRMPVAPAEDADEVWLRAD